MPRTSTSCKNVIPAPLSVRARRGTSQPGVAMLGTLCDPRPTVRSFACAQDDSARGHSCKVYARHARPLSVRALRRISQSQRGSRGARLCDPGRIVTSFASLRVITENINRHVNKQPRRLHPSELNLHHSERSERRLVDCRSDVKTVILLITGDGRAGQRAEDTINWSLVVSLIS